MPKIKQNQTKTRQKQSQKNKNKEKKHDNTQNGEVAWRPGRHGWTDDDFCIIRWIGMARKTKANKQNKKITLPSTDM
jgi:hypothetical protein